MSNTKILKFSHFSCGGAVADPYRSHDLVYQYKVSEISQSNCLHQLHISLMWFLIIAGNFFFKMCDDFKTKLM